LPGKLLSRGFSSELKRRIQEGENSQKDQGYRNKVRTGEG